MKRTLRPNVQKALEDIKNTPEAIRLEPPLRPIKGIQFGILSPDEIQSLSVAKIVKSRVAATTNGNGGSVGTVYDERLGPSHSRGICTTCNEDIRVCPGHFGHIELAIPIIHPMYIKFLVKILNCVCIICSKLKMTKEEIDLEINVLEHDRYIRYIDRLNIIVKKCENIAYCTECKYPHPDIKEVNGHLEKVYEKKRSRIEIDELKIILMKISIADLKIMGFQPEERHVLCHGAPITNVWSFRPEWLIITHLPVIPSMSRPPANEGDCRSDDDLTTSYTDIIKFNERLKEPNLDEMNKENLILNLYKHISGLFDNTNGEVTRSFGKVAKGIKERICGKDGHIRGKLTGKRVDCSARTVITADPSLMLYELGVPEEIAHTLSFPEKITPRNIKEMEALLDAGKINTIRRNGTQLLRVNIALQAGKVLKLKCGDIVYRQLRNGDTVVFNRQPTLHRGSMMAHKIRVLPGKTFRLNLSCCSPYNADYYQ